MIRPTTTLTMFFLLLAIAARCQDSLFTNSEVPARAEEDNPVELGMVFRPTVDGTITHFRLYKTDAADAKPYTLNIWLQSSRANLVRQNLQAPGQSGWLRVPLITPLAVKAGVLYVVSAYYSAGRYGGQTGVFQATRTRGNLVAPASDQVAGNGRYLYGSKTGFPSLSYSKSAYFIDVVMASQRKILIVNPGRDTVLVSPIDAGGPGDYQLHGFVSGDDVTYSWRKEGPLGLDDTMLNANTLTPTLRNLAALPHTYVLRAQDKWGTVSEQKITVEVILNPKQIVITLMKDGTPFIEIYQDGSWRQLSGTPTGTWFFKGITSKGFEGEIIEEPPPQ